MLFQIRVEDKWIPSIQSEADTLLLDLDGTMFVTFDLHWRSYCAALSEIKSDYKLSWIEFLANNVRCSKKVENHIPNIDRDLLYEIKTRVFSQNILQALPIRGAMELITNLRKAGGRYAVVTNARRGTVDALLKYCWQSFQPDAVVVHDDVEIPKPAPDCYLVAMKMLSKRPENCIAIEDSPSGAAAALAAGVSCLVVDSPYFARDEFAADVQHLSSLKDIRIG